MIVTVFVFSCVLTGTDCDRPTFAMVLESTIVCLDNSEYSRNGDFPPTRFACQIDSVNMLCNAKLRAHAESTVGLLTLAGRSSRILVTSTRDPGRIFTSMHDVKHDGGADVMAGIQKAQLALKHRQNPQQRQRIVVFVASPIPASREALVKLGKMLKKNSVAVDVINIGMEGENEQKINDFIEAVNSNDNSHALHVSAGGSNLADALMSSEIYVDRDIAASAAVGGGDGGDFAGIDSAADDPELAMVLRISMEEERARQAAAAAASQQGGEGGGAVQPSSDNAAGSPSAVGPDGTQGTNEAGAVTNSGRFDDDDDDADLYGTGDQMDVDADDEEMLRRAIELSKAEAEAESAAAAGGSSGQTENAEEDSKQDGEKKE